MHASGYCLQSSCIPTLIYLKKTFPNNEKMKLAKSGKGSKYNQGKWINEHEYRKGWCYNDLYDDDLDLATTGIKSEAELHNEFPLHEIIFFTRKNILYLENLLTLVSLFTVCKFCNNPSSVEKDNEEISWFALLFKNSLSK